MDEYVKFGVNLSCGVQNSSTFFFWEHCQFPTEYEKIYVGRLRYMYDFHFFFGKPS